MQFRAWINLNRLRRFQKFFESITSSYFSWWTFREIYSLLLVAPWHKSHILFMVVYNKLHWHHSKFLSPHSRIQVIVIWYSCDMAPSQSSFMLSKKIYISTPNLYIRYWRGMYGIYTINCISSGRFFVCSTSP